VRRQDNTAMILGFVFLFVLAIAGYVVSQQTPATTTVEEQPVKTTAVPAKVKKKHVKKKVVKRHKVVKRQNNVQPQKPVQPAQQVATYTPPRPRQSNYARDLAECKMLAQKAAGYTPEQAVKGGLIGGAVGAAAGAAIGAVLGHAGKGAAIGAAAGGFGGGTYSAIEAERIYKKTYARCMRNRGYNVLN